MRTESNLIGNVAVQYLIEQTWKGIAVQNIKKIAPTSAKLQTLQVLYSHLSNATQNKQNNKQLFVQEKDPSSIPHDSLACGITNTQQKTKQVNSKKDTVSDMSKNRKKSRKYTGQSFFSKKTVSDAKGFILQKREQDLLKLQQSQNAHQIFDANEDKIRSNKFLYQKQQQKMSKIVEQRKRKRQEQSLRNKKLLKDLKKYTFDYQGNFFGMGNMETGADRVVKMHQKKGQAILAKKQTKNPEQTFIPNDKIKQRQNKAKKQKAALAQNKNAPAFDKNRPQSIIQMLQNDDKISQGVKFIQKKGESSTTKQKPPRKLSGKKMYKLNEYKGITKQTKFKEFKYKASSSSQLDINKTAPLPLYEPASINLDKNLDNASQARSQISIINKKTLDPIPVPVLPPIKKQKKFFKGLYHRRSQSNQTIDVSGMTSRLSSKSKIIVDHQELFQANFLINQ